jgi:hypothetical protein
MIIGKTTNGVKGKKRVVALTGSVFMLHAKMTSVVDNTNNNIVLDLICAPSILKSTSAQCMANAINKRLPRPLMKLAQDRGGLICVLMSDAAKSCRKLARILHLFGSVNAPIVALHILCSMHQVSLGVNATHRPLQVLGPLFCATNILHHGHTWDVLRQTVHRTVRERLQITLTPPRPEHSSMLTATLDLLEWDTDMILEDDLLRHSTRKAQRSKARQELVVMLTGDPRSGDLVHYCPLGCCPEGKLQSIARVLDALDELFFSTMVPIPALNRWTKLFPAVAFWLTTLLVFNLIASAWCAMHLRGRANGDHEGFECNDSGNLW